MTTQFPPLNESEIKTITDNLKAAVIKADRYMPEVNRVFTDFCNHYGTVHVPTRARKPRDKATVENDVRITSTATAGNPLS